MEDRKSRRAIESALSSGDYSVALTDLEDAGTTALYAYLNGYSETIGSELITPDLGLLTNTDDGASTGTIDALVQVSNAIADEVSALGGGDVTTGSLTLVTGDLDVSVNLDQLLSDLGGSDTPSVSLGSILTDLGISTSSGISLETLLNDLIRDPSYSLGLLGSVSLDSFLADIGVSGDSFSLSTILSDLDISTSSGLDLSDVLSALGLSDSSSINLSSILIDLGLSGTLRLISTLDLTGGSVPTYDLDLAQDVLAALGNISALSSDLPSLLTDDPALDVSSLLSSLLTDLDLPLSTTGSTLSADLSNIVAELLPGLVS